MGEASLLSPSQEVRCAVTTKPSQSDGGSANPSASPLGSALSRGSSWEERRGLLSTPHRPGVRGRASGLSSLPAPGKQCLAYPPHPPPPLPSVLCLPWGVIWEPDVELHPLGGWEQREGEGEWPLESNSCRYWNVGSATCVNCVISGKLLSLSESSHQQPHAPGLPEVTVDHWCSTCEAVPDTTWGLGGMWREGGCKGPGRPCGWRQALVWRAQACVNSARRAVGRCCPPSPPTQGCSQLPGLSPHSTLTQSDCRQTSPLSKLQSPPPSSRADASPAHPRGVETGVNYCKGPPTGPGTGSACKEIFCSLSSLCLKLSDMF